MNQDTSSPPEISLSPAAVAEIKRLMAEHKLPETAGVRVGVKGGGCSGFSYTLNFDRAPAEGDLVIEQDGVRLFCDPKSMLYLRGSVLEYTDGLQGRGFHFQNPNAKGTCGCGESFSV
ncbi:MAG: iron-sulfur cluster assembly accessory protein [Planctomycetota bacterium]|nr:MAG: iron-sulfur cluster assembly accessory protein [Planctomycetota bacterium]